METTDCATSIENRACKIGAWFSKSLRAYEPPHPDTIPGGRARLGSAMLKTPTQFLPPHSGTILHAHRPCTNTASSAPGHGGMVIHRKLNGSEPVLRNWKNVPTGMVRLAPGLTS